MILPSPTYSVDKENGTLMREPDSEFTLLKDEKGIRPVCPFFELHGEWDGQTPGNGTALTLDVLKAVNEALVRLPDGFSPHPKLWRQLERRSQNGNRR